MKALKNYIEEILNDQKSESIIIEDLYLSVNTSEPIFKIVTEKCMYFAKFSKYNNFTSDFLEVIQRCSSFCIVPLISKNIDKIDLQLNIYPWIDGVDLKNHLKGRNDNEYYDMGFHCGRMLKKFHDETAHIQEENDFDIKQNINGFKEYFTDSTFSFVHQKELFDILESDVEILNRGAQRCIVHFDFKPKNIMYKNGCLFITDLESCIVADPWLDFYDKGLALCINKQKFNMGIIDGYFKNQPPIEFWDYFKILTVYGLFQISVWNINKGNVLYPQMLENYLWDIYDGLKSTIPKWYKKDC